MANTMKPYLVTLCTPDTTTGGLEGGIARADDFILQLKKHSALEGQILNPQPFGNFPKVQLFATEQAVAIIRMMDGVDFVAERVPGAALTR